MRSRTAGDDGLEDLDEGAEPRCVGIGGELLEEGRRGGRVAGEQGLRHGEADAAIGVVVLAAVTPVGEVTFDGLALRRCGGGGVSGVRLDLGEDVPGLPGLGGVTDLRAAFDRPADFLPRFVDLCQAWAGTY